MKTRTDQWVRLKLGPKHRHGTGVWHRHDGEKTLCGFGLFDRAIPGTPPPGAKTCCFCQLVTDG
jgi:hypothetical protein